MNTEHNELTPEKAQGRAAMTELSTIAAPLVAWIRAHHDPHTEVHISWDHVCLKHDSLSIPFPYSEK